MLSSQMRCDLLTDCPGYDINKGTLNALRLMDGAGSPCGEFWAGRVEIFRGGKWGTVCNDVLDDNDNGAKVICRQLGFSFGRYSDLELRGAQDVPIWLDGVHCKGTESRLIDCKPRNKFGKEDCVHNEDVSVICSNVEITSALRLPIHATAAWQCTAFGPSECNSAPSHSLHSCITSPLTSCTIPVRLNDDSTTELVVHEPLPGF
jgi:Scavenger receptor cysteine-rich domain